jgi:tetratricopeptide (TPR) repeat protein
VAGVLLAALVSVTAAEKATHEDVRDLIDNGDARAAVGLIEQRVPESARDADDWFLLAEAYHVWMDDAGWLRKRGLAKKMKRSLDRALVLDPSHVAARRELADFHHYAPWIVGGNENEAKRQLEILEEIDPGMAWATRGAHARADGDLERARSCYRKALELGPRQTDRVFALAVIEQQLDDYEASIALLDEVLATDPDYEKAYYYRARGSAMGELALERGLECGRHYVEHCDECDDSDRSYGWWRTATILDHKGETAEAIDAYREALRLNPELGGARRRLEELTP